MIGEVETLPKADDDDIEAIKIAIDFEAKGVQLYERLRKNVDAPLEKEFYDMLVSIEREHLMSLQNAYDYFQNPEDWYTIREKHRFDGA